MDVATTVFIFILYNLEKIRNVYCFKVTGITFQYYGDNCLRIINCHLLDHEVMTGKRHVE